MEKNDVGEGPATVHTVLCEALIGHHLFLASLMIHPVCRHVSFRPHSCSKISNLNLFFTFKSLDISQKKSQISGFS